MHLHPSEVGPGQVLHAVPDDEKAFHVCQAGVHGGKPGQHHVSRSAHAWSALPHVHEGKCVEISPQPFVFQSRRHSDSVETERSDYHW